MEMMASTLLLLVWIRLFLSLKADEDSDSDYDCVFEVPSNKSELLDLEYLNIEDLYLGYKNRKLSVSFQKISLKT